jgi:hypothetical protein
MAILSRFAIETSFSGHALEVHKAKSSLLKLAGFNSPIAGYLEARADTDS